MDGSRKYDELNNISLAETEEINICGKWVSI